ncbi:hypothetical protein OEZ60_12670 [Defluviimonas sp. WL0024]|uniref:Uncharacterized protein n=1 Tax=Albidovulum salinarum TaxID=2984153 RepID=A0ABT2X792_9RHOB|nr:hypothetical protein [Defluviimonas sp. WL0024]MCU9848857.1 hypothetical protein [Defluviimonas sp. WL0024]
MRQVAILILTAALLWGGAALVGDLTGAAVGSAMAKSGSSGGNSGPGGGDSDDDGSDDNSGSGSSGSGDNSGPGGGSSSGSGSSGSSGSGGNSGPGSGSSGSSGSGGNSGPGGGGSASGRSGGGSASVFGGDGIHIQFDDGRIERIRNGRFERLDARGRLLDSHAARRSELRRLKALGAEVKSRGRKGRVQNVVEVNETRGAIEITDFRGWRESLSKGSYVLKDPNGRTVARRPVTAKDVARIRAMLALD